MSNEKVKFPYMPGLDGLRAFAVLSVILYHVNIPIFQGGFLGVTVFFVLSGYLITSLLVWEWESTQTINLKQFWIRRIKRLLPGMFLLLLVLNVVIPLFRPELVSNLHKDSIAAIFYYSNWHYIFQNISYFESFGTTSLLTHFWSLAIEEQFYVGWALAILFAFVFVKKRKNIFFWTVGFAAISAIWMMVMYTPGADPSRVYYGTDTRIFSLLIGASFGLLVPSYRLTNEAHKIAKLIFEAIGIIGILVFLFMVYNVNQYDSFVYQGGMVVLSITTALWIVSLASPSTVWLNKIMTFKPLKWAGTRSYGIYLWHYPVITLMTPKVNTNGLNYFHILLEIAIIFALAELSYYYVENPIRKGTFKFQLKNTVTIAVAVCTLLITTNVFSKEPTDSDKVVAKEDIVSQNVHKPEKEVTLVKGEKENSVSSPEQVENQQEQHKITVIGDSVLINPTPYLQEKFPGIVVDTKVGRQMLVANDVVSGLKQNNTLGDIVVVGLGSNGSFTTKDMEKLIQNIGEEKQIIFINVRVPRPWESVVNEMLQETKEKYKNITVVDWYGTSQNHNEYFLNDGVHLKPEGAKAYANMLEAAIKKVEEKMK